MHSIIVVVQSLSCVQLFAAPWTATCQASLFIANSQSLLQLMSSVTVMPSSHLTLCRPLLLLPPIPPNIRVFQIVSSLHQVAKVLEFPLQHQSFQWIFRTDFLQDGLVGSPCYPNKYKRTISGAEKEADQLETLGCKEGNASKCPGFEFTSCSRNGVSLPVVSSSLWPCGL